MKLHYIAVLIVIGLQPMATVAQHTPAPSSMSFQAISGTMLDPSGEVIAKAYVQLTTVDASQVAKTWTDNTGSFHFDRLTRQKYPVLV